MTFSASPWYADYAAMGMGLIGLTPEQVARVYRSIDAKRAAARYLHEPPVLIEPCRQKVW